MTTSFKPPRDEWRNDFLRVRVLSRQTACMTASYPAVLRVGPDLTGKEKTSWAKFVIGKIFLGSFFSHMNSPLESMLMC